LPASKEPILPELVLFQTIKAGLEVLREDWEQFSSDEEKSFIFRVLGNKNALQRYDMLAQAKTVFFRPVNPNESRYIDVSMGFDTDRIQKKLPTIHILIQSDNPKDDSLGIGYGNFDVIFGDEPEDDEAGTYNQVYSRRFNQQANILISGDNTNEKILIYYVLRALLISYIPYFNELGLENVYFSGGDVQINADVAGRLYMRSLNMGYDYDFTAPSLTINEFATKIFYRLIIKNDDAIKNPDPEPEEPDNPVEGDPEGG